MMKIIIVGVGKVGRTLTEFLSYEGHDVTVVDTDTKLVEEVVDSFDVRGVIGNGASYEILLEAEVGKSDLLIASTDSDEVNILSCLVGKKYGVKHTVARVRNPEYSKQVDFFRRELDVSMIVNPELETASEMAKILNFPSAINIEQFAKGRVELVEIQVKGDSPLVGKRLMDIPKELQIRILICAVERDGEAIIPDGQFLIQEGDKIHYTAPHEDLVKSFRKFGILMNKVHDVMIVGGAKIAYYLARSLDPRSVQVKIIEMDKRRCHELSELLPDADIIYGEGTDQELLMEEGIDDVDALITLSGFDEENIIISLFAKNRGVPKIITKLNRYNYSDILKSLNLDSILSPKALCANQIIRYVRSLENAVGSEMLTLYKLINNQVEATEFFINQETSYTGITLKDLTLKPGILIASIIRGNHAIIPSGEDELKVNDRVILVAREQQVRNLEDMVVRR